MTTLREEFEALMPEPAGYSPFPGEFYPSEQVDAAVKDDPFVTRLYTADQVRKMFDDATERAAVLCEVEAGRASFVNNHGAALAAEQCAAAIRAQAGGDHE